jgi:Mrp family chromosome partitioning ATPase
MGFGKNIINRRRSQSPRIANYLQVPLQSDFLDVLCNNTDIQSGTSTLGHENLSVLPIGKGIKNPSSILSSQELNNLLMILKERYDFILIDSPPVIGLPDMNIIKNLVDGVLLVIRAEKTQRDALRIALEVIGTDKIVGVVLNNVRGPASQRYRYQYSKT